MSLCTSRGRGELAQAASRGGRGGRCGKLSALPERRYRPAGKSAVPHPEVRRFASSCHESGAGPPIAQA